MKIITLTFLFTFLGTSAFAQHAETSNDHDNEMHHSMKSSHRLTLGLGHTYLSEGVVDGKKQWLALPSWSFNYDYWVADHWAVGLQLDFISESFIIEDGEDEEIERSFPISFVPSAIFKPGKHIAFIAGIGAEYTENETLTLTRLGVEYGVEMPKGWEFSAIFLWDNKWNHYNSWSIALGVSRIISKSEKH